MTTGQRDAPTEVGASSVCGTAHILCTDCARTLNNGGSTLRYPAGQKSASGLR
jgi:hypothetical protein